MKTKLFTLFLVFFIGHTYSQDKYNVFENESPLIEKLEFTTKAMHLTLSKKGIAYVQKDMRNNPKVIAKLVKKLHNEMVGGSSKLKSGCIATQVYWHCLFYDLNKDSESEEDNYAALSHLSVLNQTVFNKLKKSKEYKIPKNPIKTKFNYLSNDRMRSIDVAYVELFVNGCTLRGNYALPPNIVSLISKWFGKYEKLKNK